MFNRTPRTVNEAVAASITAAENLDTVADHCNSRISANRAEIERLEARVSSDQSELTRAESVAKKLRAILEE